MTFWEGFENIPDYINMCDLDFTPVFSELIPVVKDLRFSVMYFGWHCGKNVLITKHESKTVMVVLKENDERNIEFSTTISSREKLIKTSLKIQGNGNLILLLDGEGNLWKLINAFEFCNENDECLYLIDEKCFYEWVPFKKFEFCRVMEITAYQTGFACLLENQQKKKMLQVFLAENINHSEDYTFKELNDSKSQKYQLKNIIISNMELENIKEAIIVTDEFSGITHALSSAKKAEIVNISNETVISTLYFSNTNCLLLCYHSGTFHFVKLNDKCQPVKDYSLYAFKKVFCVEKCNCCEACFVWSDGFTINHTNIHFQLEEVCFAKLVHLQVKLNIAGVRAFSKTMNGILAVTYNHFYYYISLNREVKPEKLLMSPDEILSKIVQGSMVIESLNKEINISQEYLEFKEIMQTSNLLDQVELEAKNRYISIKSKIKHVLRKDFWKIRETMSINKKHCVMYHDIETDLYEGMVVKIKSKFIKKNKVELSLLGDFGPEFDILLIPIGNLEGESNNDEEELTKTLSEIAKIRNPYVK